MRAGYSPPLLGFRTPTCSAEGCSAPGSGWSGRCGFHEALSGARNLNPQQFDRLRKALATATPLTDEDRRERAARSALATIEWVARDLKRSKKRAKKSGATDGQIAEAIRKGKAQS